MARRKRCDDCKEFIDVQSSGLTPRNIAEIEKFRPLEEEDYTDCCTVCFKPHHMKDMCNGTYICICGEDLCKACKMADKCCEGSSKL